jgi:glycosyltransferase involved in cell wall biosynthesis
MDARIKSGHDGDGDSFVKAIALGTPGASLTARSARPIAFVLKGYPRLSESFIAQEIRALELAGLDLRIVSLRQPTDGALHPVHREIQAPVLYLPEYLHAAARRVWRGWRIARNLPGYEAAWRIWLRDLRRDLTRNRIRRFGQALVLASELPEEVGHLHAHFLHTPASVARYAAIMRGLSWTVSAHAKDIWTIPDWEKREKLEACRWLVTCTASGHAHLAALAPASRVELAYHGLDFSRFPPSKRPPAERDGIERDAIERDGGDPARPVRILSVGRAVAKKGYDGLLAALARLPPVLNWRFVHIGGGALRDTLRQQAEQLGIASRIEWRGAQPQERVLAAYREADIFVLASRVAADGDRDGLPNVLMEAQSQGVACLATAVPGICELILDETSGLLVPPDSPEALAAALARLIGEPQLRDRLGAAGEERIRRDFSMAPGIARLVTLFTESEAARESVVPRPYPSTALLPAGPEVPLTATGGASLRRELRSSEAPCASPSTPR